MAGRLDRADSGARQRLTALETVWLVAPRGFQRHGSTNTLGRSDSKSLGIDSESIHIA